MKNRFLIFLLPGMFALSFLCSCEKSAERRAEIDDEKIREYLEKKNISAIRDDSGLYYVIEADGFGDHPEITSYVTVSYTGLLMEDEKVFDGSSSTRFLLSGLIRAWQIGIPKIGIGGIIHLYAPSGLAYGSVARQNIPANSNLVFEIKLIDIYNP